LFAGVDPIEARRAAKGAARAEIARQLTFKQCADKFIAAQGGMAKRASRLAMAVVA
jgi:hypothetical protein